MNKKQKLAIGIVATLALSGGGFSFAQSVNNVNSSQVIYACVTGVNGNIVRVSNVPRTCPRGTTPISWNTSGPKGDQGQRGETGPQGPKGANGNSGAASSSGISMYLSNGEESYPILQESRRRPGYLNTTSSYVLVDSVLWKLNFDSTAEGERRYFLTGDLPTFFNDGSSVNWIGSGFTSSDCSSGEIIFTSWDAESLPINKAYTEFYDSKSYLLRFDKTISDVKSVRVEDDLGSSQCLQLPENFRQAWNSKTPYPETTLGSYLNLITENGLYPPALMTLIPIEPPSLSGPWIKEYR